MTKISEMNRCEQFGVLAKHWSPGLAKTRLASACGEDKAAQLHLAFLTTTLRRFASLQTRRVLSFTPDRYRTDFEKIADSEWTLLPQRAGDLGRRISDYFQEAFSSGQKRVLLVGADTPSLPMATVVAAFAALEQHDLVFVPSDDGGYCLIGSSRPVEPLVSNIDWGTQSVWKQTQNKIRSLRWSAIELASWYDVDQEKDLTRLLHDLASKVTKDRVAGDACDANLIWLYGKIMEICEGLSLPEATH